MTNAVDTLMILLFPVLDSLPFTLPRYWISRDRLRIPFRYVVLLQTVLTSLYSAVFYRINLGGQSMAAQYTTIVRYFFLFTYLTLAFVLIKDMFPKLMFTWLLFLSWQLFVLGNANFIESRFFWDFSDQRPYLVYNLARVLIYLVTFPFLMHFFNRTITPSLKISDRRIWKSFWLIPLFSTLFGMLYCTVTDIYAYASWQFLVSRYLMLFGTCYVSYVVLNVLEISRSNTQMEDALKYADRNLLTQKKQYDSLASHMDDMKKARHDLRQHLAVVQSYLDRDDKTGLAEYIDIYKNELPPDILELYCRNDIVNAVICYYASLAREAKIQFDATADYPENCAVSGTDITVLLGNLLENALEACKRERGKLPFIRLRMKQRGQSALLILVDNTSLVPVAFYGDTPLSSKREGVGIGIASMRDIVSRYNGTVEFEQKDEVFYASVYLELPEEVVHR